MDTDPIDAGSDGGKTPDEPVDDVSPPGGDAGPGNDSPPGPDAGPARASDSGADTGVSDRDGGEDTALPACLRDFDRDGFNDGEVTACADGPPVIHDAISGATSSFYHSEWARLSELQYYAVSMSSVRLPSGAYRFSSVFQKDAKRRDYFSYRGYSESELKERHAELIQKRHRMFDLNARQGTSGRRYDVVWVEDVNIPSPTTFVYDVSLSSLSDKLSEQAEGGYRPIRLHGYATDVGTLYSGVWVKDGLASASRVILDKNSSDYGAASNEAVADGFHCIDISAYPVGNEVRYTGVFVKDSTIGESAALRDLNEGEFAAKQREYTEANYVMVDVEYYSLSISSDVPRFAGVWVRKRDANLVASFGLTNTTGWSGAARTALTDMQTRLKAHAGNAGFLIEDLTNGNYVGYHIHEPFYMANTATVLIAASVLERVDAGALALEQGVVYQDAELLQGGHNPTAAGSHTLRESLAFMLNESSINATDRLVGLVQAKVINRYLESSGIVNMGEVTPVCELDLRIYERQHGCVRTMSCRNFERWLRNGETPIAPIDQDCVANLTVNDDLSHEKYYATLANSITPLQYGQFWRRIVEARMITAPARDALVGLLLGTENGFMSGLEGVFFDMQAGKFGDAREVQSWVGLGYDSKGAAGLSDDAPQYSLALFSEDLPDDLPATRKAAQTLMQALAADALTILRDRR